MAFHSGTVVAIRLGTACPGKDRLCHDYGLSMQCIPPRYTGRLLRKLLDEVSFNDDLFMHHAAKRGVKWPTGHCSSTNVRSAINNNYGEKET